MHARGFSLAEVLVATGVLATGLLALAHLVAMSAAANGASRSMAFATVLAAQRVEVIRSAPSVSPSDHVEHLSGNGTVLGTGGSPPRGAIYTRRSRIGAMPGSGGGIVISVAVELVGAPHSSNAGARLVAAHLGTPP